MTYSNYNEIPALVAQLIPFQGNTLQSRVVDNNYTVFSYSTPILKINVNTGEWVFDNQKYSVTTSKQQTVLRRGLDLLGIKTDRKKRTIQVGINVH